MIDTHTHIYLEEFDEDRDQVMQRAFDAGVDFLIFPNVDFDTFHAMQELHNKYPKNTAMAMGLHPTSVGNDFEITLMRTLEEIDKGGYVAVGEIGMDLYWDKTFAEQQKIVLQEQLRKASELSLPAIIHCREALKEIAEVFDSCDFALPRMVFHSFTGTANEIRTLRNYGDFYFGFNGIATFKNSHIEDTIREATPDRVLLETDSPYLAPVPYRGKRNESAFLPKVAEKLALVFDMPIDDLIKKTTDNTHDLFNI